MESKVEIMLSYIAAAQLSAARYSALSFWMEFHGKEYVKENFQDIIRQTEEDVTSAAQRMAKTMFSDES